MLLDYCVTHVPDHSANDDLIAIALPRWVRWQSASPAAVWVGLRNLPMPVAAGARNRVWWSAKDKWSEFRVGDRGLRERDMSTPDLHRVVGDLFDPILILVRNERQPTVHADNPEADEVAKYWKNVMAPR
jgi:hypothetical protein